ncbi:MAG TPA: hypothetical protein H9769_09970 [Candidatus Microbacterium pullistercoris]|nr:hypothetical protein [Candidatus Microbacterium pullistercoris]
MSSMLLQSLTASASACLLLGLAACGAHEEVEAAPDAAPVEETPAAEVPPTLEEAQADIQWPDGMTLAVPEGMNFETVNAFKSCDGALDSTELWASDATDETTLTYLNQMMDAWGFDQEGAAPLADGSFPSESFKNPDAPALRKGNLAPEGSIESFEWDHVGKAWSEDLKRITWETLAEGGYRFFLYERTDPGNYSKLEDTPESEWVDFPRPNTIAFQSCEMRTESHYGPEAGMYPPSATWTLRAVEEVSSYDSSLQWFQTLKEDGWVDEIAEYDGAPQPGEPGASVTNGDFVASYFERLDPLTIVVSDRAAEKFFNGE